MALGRTTPTLAAAARRHVLVSRCAAAAPRPAAARPQQRQVQQATAAAALARPLLQRALCRASAADSSDASPEELNYPEPCAPAFVVTNQESPHYTQFSIDVKDYPGLLRVIMWVMNGMGCRVHNAVLKTTDDGQAQDSFWVTDLRGRKLRDSKAADVCERLEDFVSYCAPPAMDGDFTEFRCGDIVISNTSHPLWTEVTITAELFSPGLLLELSSIIHGQGLSIAEAVVRGGSESPIPPDSLSHRCAIPEPPPGKRVMRFWLTDNRSGLKLEYSDVSSLLYTLRVVLGDGALPTRPPGSELASLSCDCAGSAGTLSTLSDADDMGLLARGSKVGGRAGLGLA